MPTPRLSLALFIDTLILVGGFAASVPASAQTPRMPSLFVPGDATISAAAKDQVSPFLCQGGSTILAVWSDNRANSTGGYEGETSWDIYGMRFNDAGVPLETVPFAIAAGPASQKNPRASWNGADWLVVFESVDFGGTGYYQASLEALRVSPDGQVLDPKPIKIYNDTPVGGTWAVASDGSSWVVVNQGTSVKGDLVASRISSAGILLDPGPRSLVGSTYYMRGVTRLAFAGGVFLLAYEESITGHDPTNAIRFDADLNLLDAAPSGLAPAPLNALISNGSGFYALWIEQLPDYTLAVKGNRIGINGQKLDGAGVNISGPNQPAAYTATSVAWDGADWKVTWGSSTGTRLARVSASGLLLDPGGVPLAGAGTGVSASAGNGSLQLAWSEFVTANSSYEVYSSYVNASNAASPQWTLSVAAPSQLRADIAASGGGYMMVYRSSTASGSRVLAQPLDAAGTPLTGQPVELDAAGGSSYPGYPSVAWNGSLYMAVWDNADGVVGRRLQPDGTLVDSAPLLVMSPGFGPADVAALGADFLVVGRRCGINCQYIFPMAARVRGSDGFILDSSPIPMGVTFASSPQIAALGGRWLVVWQDNVSHDNPIAYTRGTFIDTDGTKTPDFVVHGPYSTAGGNGIFSIGLASSGGVALMVQSQELTSGWETDLLARLIDPDGTVHPYVNITPWRDDQYRPRVAWDGSQFVVVWQDQKTDLGGYWSLEQIDARSDLMGMRITPSGSIVDPQGFVVSNSAAGEAYPNLASTGGVSLIAASLVRNQTPFAGYRIGYDLFGAGGNPWPVAVAAASPETGDAPLSVVFDSTGSGDPGGSVSGFHWDFGDGATSDEPSPTHLYLTGGPYIATLEVTDDGGARAMQQILVSAFEPNIPPVAVSESNIASGPVPLAVIFDAAGTHDPDGFVGNIRWDLGDGSESWGATAYHTFSTQGTYQVTMTAFDRRGGAGTAAPLTITVGPPLAPASPGGLQAIAFSPEWINMTWSDNSDNEEGFEVERCPGTTSYCDATPSAWSQAARTGRNINYYGDVGLPSSTTFSYRVRAFNVTAPSTWSNTSTATTRTYPPVAVNAPSVLNGSAPLEVTFDGAGSHDPDGAITSWSWAFGDGATATGPIVSHAFTSTGYFYTSLTVTDSLGETNTAYATIHVQSAGSMSPATSDAGTILGQIYSGSYLDTQTENNVAEVLSESQSGGTPQTRRSQLEHEWSFTVAPGSMQTFYLDAWHSPNSEGDDFVFEYSRDNLTWNPMVTVTKTSHNGTHQSYTFVEDVTGQLWVRVRDLDRTAGRSQLDKVSIEEMFVASSASTGYCGEVAPPGGAPATVSMGQYGQLTLTWDPSCASTDTDYAIYQGRLGDFGSHMPVQCSTGGARSFTFTPSAGDSYYLVVPNDTRFEGRYGSSSSGAEIPAGRTRCYPAAFASGCY